MSSPVVDPESDLRKCPECGVCWCSTDWIDCNCLGAGNETHDMPAIALTQPELDALLEAERERVIQAFGISKMISAGLLDSVRAELRGAK